MAKDNSSVRQSPHYQEIKDCLVSGWSAPAIRKYLLEAYPGTRIPHEKAIQRWREKHMPEFAIVPKSVIMNKLAKVDYKVDLVKHLSNLVALLGERFDRAISKEAEMGDFPLDMTDKAAASYMAALEHWKEAAQDLGLFRSREPAANVFDLRNQNLNVMDMPPELIEDFNATIKEIANLRLEEGHEQRRIYDGDAPTEEAHDPGA